VLDCLSAQPVAIKIKAATKAAGKIQKPFFIIFSWMMFCDVNDIITASTSCMIFI